MTQHNSGHFPVPSQDAVFPRADVGPTEALAAMHFTLFMMLQTLDLPRTRTRLTPL